MIIDLYPLTELLEFIVDNRGKTVPTEDSGMVLIATNCIKNNELFPVFEKVRYLSKSTYENWFRAHPIPGDIIFVNKGTPGRVCLVPDPVNFCIAQDMVAFRANPNKVYNKYLFAALRSDSIQEQIGNMHVGTLIPHVKKSHLDKLLIPVPDIISQKAIGDFYYEISYKIELNNRIIANLEAQAQAIFNEWFMAVDIDFPVGVLSDIAEVNPTRTLLKGQLATYIEMSSLSTGNSFPDNWVENTPFNGGMKFKNGDTLIARITPCLENGKTAFISCLDDGAVGFGSTEYVVLSAKTGYCNEMLYFLARNEDFRNYAIQNMNGSSGRQRVSGETIGNYEMAVPTKEASKEFETFAKPIMETIHNCAMQNRKLAQTRDALLPKLMSGEIEVPEEDEGWHQ